jgi:hypothetical protein
MQGLVGRHGVEDVWLGRGALLHWLFDLAVTEVNRELHPRYLPVIREILAGVPELASICELRGQLLCLRHDADPDVLRRVGAYLDEHYHPEIVE